MDDHPSTHGNANHVNINKALAQGIVCERKNSPCKLGCVCRMDNQGSVSKFKNKLVWGRTNWSWERGCGRKGCGIRGQCNAIAVRGCIPSPSAQGVSQGAKGQEIEGFAKGQEIENGKRCS